MWCSQMSRILVLTTTYPNAENDWTGAFIRNLVVAIKNRGFDIEVLAPADGTYHGCRLIDGFPVFRFGYFLPRSLERLTKGAGGIPENINKSALAKIQIIPMMAIFVLRAIMASRRCDLIYANWIGAGLAGAIASCISRKPLVVSFRGDDGYLARDKLMWKLAAKCVIHQSSHLTAVSNELLDIMRGLGADSESLSVPRFGVDTSVFFPANEDSYRGDSVRIIFVGSLIPKKGLQDLICALSSPEMSNVRLVILGDGYFGAELQKLAEEKLENEQVEWKGIIPPVDVARIMRESDFLVITSYTEGSPNVIKEAMATGLPVIGTRIGGIPDLVSNNETGLLYDAGDIKSLRECIRIMAKDRETRLKMGRLARKKLDELGLSWDLAAEDFDSIFSKATEIQ